MVSEMLHTEKSSSVCGEGLQLALMANREFWSTYDPEDKSTAPTKNEVVSFLRSCGASKNLAESIDKVLRPTSLKCGGRPKKWKR